MSHAPRYCADIRARPRVWLAAAAVIGSETVVTSATAQDFTPATAAPTAVIAAKERPLVAYLTKPRVASGRYLEHGQLQLSAGLAYPWHDRFSLTFGLFDHLTVGVAMQWQPSEKRPRFAPEIALAFFRGRYFEYGAHYHRTLFPAPEVPESFDAKDLSLEYFVPRADYYLFGFTYQRPWLSAGADAGVASRRVAVRDEVEWSPFRFRTRIDGAGALFVRVGNRCLGASLRGYFPQSEVTLQLEWRPTIVGPRLRGCQLTQQPMLTASRANISHRN